eukprot:TRINITY_DN1050_c1_g1_i1.p1 TRINITY_DN1050_c1_g1~~TRINITY_DN1050_c1_g1_i1.p1  ORF type:complete len:195 (-),score=119.58 TRINITY_DN1050_c1_g1_i1:200-784(-)
MGGNNTKGLWLCEQIFPTATGRSFIPQEKLQKAIQQQSIPQSALNPPSPDPDVDEDMDTIVEKHFGEVWAYYDKKSKGFLTKSECESFFKDALEVYALRQGKKVKDVLAVSQSQAFNQIFKTLDKQNTGKVDKATFEEFIYSADLDEALENFIGTTGFRDVKNTVKFVDLSTFAAAAQNKHSAASIVYREYPDD